MSAAPDTSLISKLFLEGKYKEAEQLCDQQSHLNTNSRFFYLYGLCCYKNGNISGALIHFEKATALNPEDHDSLFNLAVARGELNMHVPAINAYQALLVRAPHYTKALPNLGQALMKVGRYAEGTEVFDKALKADPEDMNTASLRMEYECLYLPMHDRIAVCNKTLSMPKISHTQKHTALIYRATAEWVTQDIPSLERSLREAHNIPLQPQDQGYKNMVVYRTFLERLLAYRKLHPDLYEGDGTPLYLVGDSHSLSYAGLNILWHGKKYKIHSHLIMGAQARHLSSGTLDAKRFALSRYVNSLPGDAHLFCAFGEIDCRTDHGILPHWQNHGGTLEQLIKAVTEGLCRSIREMTDARQIKLSFLAIPAPLRASGDRQYVIKGFNENMFRLLAGTRHSYTDLYSLTCDIDGFSQGALHIDNFHLQPEALQKVLLPGTIN